MSLPTSFPKQDIADCCYQYGPLLATLPLGVDGVRLMWAIAGNESTFGVDCTPRFEPRFFTGGKYADNPPMPTLIAAYGVDAAKSYGPWQTMLCNAIGYKPNEFGDVEKCAQAFLAFMNRSLRAQKPQTLEEVFDMYNSGNWRDAIVPHEYIAKGLRNYEAAIPVRSAPAAASAPTP